ncbi:MAG TPA: hypothetical protein VHM31_01645 [Polyangia bacterium]|nr:hypothetical protein [Polyangia bacterium]
MPAAVRPTAGPSDAERYGWPGLSADAQSATGAPAARAIVRAQARTVGFVPAARALAREQSLAPLVRAVAEALLRFLATDVAIVDSWPTWPWAEAFQPGDRSMYRQRELAPRLIELAPTPCGDPFAAAVALQGTLETRPGSAGVVLVNLAEYSKPGVVPSLVDQLDGVVIVAARYRTPVGGLGRMRSYIPEAKRLGVVMVG